MRRYNYKQDQWLDVPLIRYYVRPVGPPSLLEVFVWSKSPGQPDEFIPTGIFIEPTDLGYGNGLGIDPDRNPTAYRQVWALRTLMTYSLHRSLLAGADVTVDFVRQVVGQWRKRPGHVLDADFMYDQLEAMPTRTRSKNERTALTRRLHELTVSLTDGFVQNPAIRWHYN